MPRLGNPVCILHLQYISVLTSTFQGLHNHMWLVATVLDSAVTLFLVLICPATAHAYQVPAPHVLPANPQYGSQITA